MTYELLPSNIIYVYEMDEYASINQIPLKDDSEELYFNVNFSTRNHSQLNIDWTLYSDQDFFISILNANSSHQMEV